MIEGPLHSISSFVKGLSEIHSAVCRVTYNYSALSNQPPEDYALNLYGISSDKKIEISQEILKELPSYSLKLNLFESGHEAKIWDTHPGKILIVSFIDSITDIIESSFQQWEALTDPRLVFFVIVFGKKVKRGNYKKIQFKTGDKELQDKFNIKSFPSVSILYESFEVLTTSLDKLNISLIMRLLNYYSPFEGLGLYALPSPFTLKLFSNKLCKEKDIVLDSLVVVDFCDNSCLDILEDAPGLRAKYISVFVGIDEPLKEFKYSFGSQGLNHITAQFLKLIEFPTTYIFSNGIALWKGNKRFIDFKMVLQHFSQGTSESVFNVISDNDFSASVQIFKKELESAFGDSSDAVLDLKVIVSQEISQYEILQKKIRTRFISHCIEVNESKVLELYSKVKTFLPNLTLEMHRIEQLFPTKMPDSNKTLVVENLNPQELALKYKQKFKSTKLNLNDLSTQLKYLQEENANKDHIIEKQQIVISELKSTNLGKLKLKVDKMIEEKVKFGIEIEDKNKIIRELNQRIFQLKKEIENNDIVIEKRETQMNSLIQKIKNLESELQKGKTEMAKKVTHLTHLQGEITELRPSKEAMWVVEKQATIIEDLKKQLANKDSEISMMKGLIKTWQQQYVSHMESQRSPKKFPPISTNRSGNLPKVSIASKSDSISKSLKYSDITEFYDDFDKDSIKLESELKKIKEDEELKIREEIEKEAKENSALEREEAYMKSYLLQQAEVEKLEEIRKAEAIMKADEEKARKVKPANDETRKVKGKSPVKQPAKSGARKK